MPNTRQEQLDLTTHIGNVKSHTGVTHSDAAHTAARGVVDGDILPYATYTEADPHRRPSSLAYITRASTK